MRLAGRMVMVLLACDADSQQIAIGAGMRRRILRHGWIFRDFIVLSVAGGPTGTSRPKLDRDGR